VLGLEPPKRSQVPKGRPICTPDQCPAVPLRDLLTFFRRSVDRAFGVRQSSGAWIFLASSREVLSTPRFMEMLEPLIREWRWLCTCAAQPGNATPRQFATPPRQPTIPFHRYFEGLWWVTKNSRGLPPRLFRRPLAGERSPNTERVPASGRRCGRWSPVLPLRAQQFQHDRQKTKRVMTSVSTGVSFPGRAEAAGCSAFRGACQQHGPDLTNSLRLIKFF
jgi:hypothetical protein